jgi:dimethylhistidine N-methyltransferase
MITNIENRIKYPSQDLEWDVIHGLSKKLKRIPSVYLYDEEGSRLFDQITELPEYYLTRSEIEILGAHGETIGKRVIAESGSREVEVIELGAGSGEKTELFLEALKPNFREICYTAIDISASALKDLETRVGRTCISTRTIQADYVSGLNLLENRPGALRLFLFFGSNIGNYTRRGAGILLRRIRGYMEEGSYLLIGFDLKKDWRILLPAYSDSEGVTKSFNLNLLSRINREMAGDFDIQNFDHLALYNPARSAMESYLICRKAAKVNLLNQGRSFTFKEQEAIFTECSVKYDPSDIDELAHAGGYSVRENFFDDRHYFAESLWRAI